MLGQIRKHFTSTDSTNRVARDLVGEGAAEGTLITADFQTHGRGRRERRWISSHSENVLASYILYPSRPVDEWGGLPLLASLAVGEMLTSIASLKPMLKWPNDVLIAGKKISGILVESGCGAVSWAVAGIGINVNQMGFPGEYRQFPTSMYLEAQRLFDIDTIITALSEALTNYYSLWTREGTPSIIEEWKKRTAMLGKPVRIETESGTTHAVAEDISEDGSLIIRTSAGERERVYAGDVTLSLQP